MIDVAARRGLDRSRPSATGARPLGSVPSIAVPVCTVSSTSDVPAQLALAGRLAQRTSSGHTATVSAAVYFPNVGNPSHFNAEPMSFLEIE